MLGHWLTLKAVARIWVLGLSEVVQLKISISTRPKESKETLKTLAEPGEQWCSKTFFFLFLLSCVETIDSLSIEVLTQTSWKERCNQNLFKETLTCAQHNKNTLYSWLRSWGNQEGYVRCISSPDSLHLQNIWQKPPKTKKQQMFY